MANHHAQLQRSNEDRFIKFKNGGISMLKQLATMMHPIQVSPNNYSFRPLQHDFISTLHGMIQFANSRK